jgi:hypothetical protein
LISDGSLTERDETNAGRWSPGPYSPPEILESKTTPDFRSDHPVSVVWYELLTRTPMTPAAKGLEGMREAFAGKLIQPSRPPRRPCPRRFWKAIDDAVCRGLAFNQRTDSATHLARRPDEIHLTDSRAVGRL